MAGQISISIKALILPLGVAAAALAGPERPSKILPAGAAMAAPAIPVKPTAPAAPSAPAGQGALPALPGLRRYQMADVDAAGLARRLEAFRGGAFKLDLGSSAWDLDLEPSGIRAPGYAVRHLTADGLVTVAPTPDRSFRGRVRGKPGSSVRIAFQDGRINGFVDPGEGDRYFVEPLEHLRKGLPASSGKVPHILYRERDVLPDSAVSCGLDAPGAAPGARPLPGTAIGETAIPMPPAASGGPSGWLPEREPGQAPGARALGKEAAEPCALVELAVAVQNSMVRGLGGAAAAEKRINDIYNMVDGLYQDPQINIHVRISEIIIETEDRATWGATVDINRYLTALTSWMGGANGFRNAFDVGSLWYYSLGGGTVGLAYVGVVCNNNRANVIRYFTATSRSMMIDAAHEMGHNFSAPHISNPAWIMNPSITGSNDQWDASTVSKIVAHKKTRTCLSACAVPPIAGFTVSGASACAETRTFTDASTGDPTAWLWEFGDGTSSNQKNPTHTYAAAGRYTVRLSASNAFGSHAASRGDLRVKAMPAPIAKGADGCAPASLVLSAQGSGTLRWYDTASGGSPLATGPQYTTPVLTQARTFYVEDGEPDLPVTKVGPPSTSIGPGSMFATTGDRRLFFDVHRPATLVSALVNAASAGPRLVEILDARNRRVMAKSVQVPAGTSRVALGFSLEPGNDYAIKLVGSGDSANLFRNTSGADYPYPSPDSLVTITGSDATAADTVTQAGYYYFFYDWEIRESGCASARVPVQARLTCTSDLAGAPADAYRADLRPVSAGRYLLEAAAPQPATLRIRIRSLDGSLVRSLDRAVSPGASAIPLSLPRTARLLTADIQLGPHRTRAILPPF